MLRSASRGNRRSGPRPPALRGWLAHAKWEYSESVDTATTSVLSSLNWARASLKARISVGQTKVKSLRCVSKRCCSAIEPVNSVHWVEEQNEPVRMCMVLDIDYLIGGTGAYHLPRKSESEISWKTVPTTAVDLKAGAGR